MRSCDRVAGDICGFGWLGQLSHHLLTVSGQKLLKQQSCLSSRFIDLVGVDNNPRHYVAPVPVLQMSELSPGGGKCLVCACLAVHCRTRTSMQVSCFLSLRIVFL